ncbi:hypothetical protein ACN2XU_02940 [Primorskyibacter sp. 2E107]|uniref:hypothetical protein n=1 Tax=Primorskyibacter sp. 2E107 TaxID=3403458 RepID=UPI003AF8EEA4
MDFWTIVMAAYCLTTIMAISLTYQEQKRRAQSTPVYMLIGYMLCMVWPAVATVMVVLYRPGRAASWTASQD